MTRRRFISVRLHYGRKLHAISEDSDSPRMTMCGRSADAAVVETDVPDCVTCREWIERSRGR